MAGKTITSANAGLFLTVQGLYPVPVQLQGFSADNVFETENMVTTETVMGVDGHLSAGWVAVGVTFNVTLMPDSDSNKVFEDIYNDEQTNREKRILTLGVRLPSIGRSAALTRGFLTSYPPLPTAARVLQARRYTMMFEKLTIAPI
jgi:hypothetical protein